MFCTQCGEKIADDAKFCTHCGAPVAAQAEASAESDAAAAEEAADEKSEKSASEEPTEQEDAPEADGAADEEGDAEKGEQAEKSDATDAAASEAGEEAASTADAEADAAAAGDEAADGADAGHEEAADDDTAPEDAPADDEAPADEAPADEAPADEPAGKEAPAQGSLAAAAALIAATKQDQGVPEGLGTPKDGEAEWGSDKTTVIPGPKDGFAAKTADAGAAQTQAGVGGASFSAAQAGSQAAWQQAPAETQQWATAPVPAPAPQKRGHSVGFAVGMVFLAVAVALVVGVGAMFALGMGPFARTDGAGGGQSTIIPVDVTVEVPDVLGMDEHDAMDELRDAGLAVGDVDEDYSSEYPEGTVCEQSPNGGDDADEGSEVDLVISKGPEVVIEHRYQMVTRAMSWADAQSWCEANGGYLATIDSAEEYQEVLNALSGSTTVCWLGGMRTGSSWEWVDGEPFSYTAWASGEPNNDGGNEDRLALLKVNGAWSWYDVPSDVRGVYPDYRLCFVMETEVEVPVD